MQDETILALLFARDERALSALDDVYRRVSTTLAAQITGNTADAEECWSDAMLAVWNSIPPASPQSLKAYVLRIVRNRALNRVKARETQKRSAILVELDDCVRGETADFEPSELGLVLDAFLASLPREDATVFMRRYFCSESVQSIAARSGYSENKVSKRLAKLRKKLKNHLEKEGIPL